MKILIIQPWISYRGSETVSVLEAYYFKKLGHTAKIACLYVDKERLPPHGAEVEYILPPKGISNLFKSSKLFFFIFNVPVLFWLVLRSSHGFDFLNPHNLPSPWIASLVKKIVGVKVVWTAHGVPPVAGFNQNKLNLFFWNLGLKYLDYWAIRNTDAVLSVSQKIQKNVKDRYAVNSLVIYPPIEFSVYKGGKANKIRKKLDIPKDKFVLLHVSDLRPLKNPDISVQTLSEISAKISNALLLFVGSTRGHEWIKTLSKGLGVEDRVYFQSFVRPEDLKDYFSLADLILVPYWKTEGCPVIPFQALASSKLSIVARGSGVDEVVRLENCGFIAKPNAGYFSKKVLYYFNRRKGFNTMVKKGRVFVKENLSGKRYVVEMVKAVNGLK